MNKNNDYFICPNCGMEVKRNALSCPGCGSDDTTGWSDAPADMDILPDDDYDYQESLEREFSSGSGKNAFPSWVAITGFILLLLLLWVFLK